jgi:putative hydrolase of the HAD superfamily
MIAQQVSTSAAASVLPPPTFASTEIEVRRGQHSGLVLDLDDTLYPREQFVLGGFAAVARHVAASHEVSADEALITLIHAHDGSDRGQEFQALCRHFDLSLDVIPGLVAVFREHRPALRLRPGVVDTLYRLRREGWRMAILTNGLPSVQAAKVEALGLRRLVDAVVYAEQYASGGKPDAAAFAAAVGRLNLPASSCIAVGDDPACDVRGGRAAGLATIRVSGATLEGPVQHEADVVIERFEELPDVAHALLGLVDSHVA